jgi:hypothetical protein
MAMVYRQRGRRPGSYVGLYGHLLAGFLSCFNFGDGEKMLYKYVHFCTLQC